MMMFGWLVVPLFLFGIGAWLFGWRPQSGGEPRRTPEEILRERYARGEISHDEYMQMREDLRGSEQ